MVGVARLSPAIRLLNEAPHYIQHINSLLVCQAVLYLQHKPMVRCAGTAPASRILRELALSN